MVASQSASAAVSQPSPAGTSCSPRASHHVRTRPRYVPPAVAGTRSASASGAHQLVGGGQLHGRAPFGAPALSLGLEDPAEFLGSHHLRVTAPDAALEG